MSRCLPSSGIIHTVNQIEQKTFELLEGKSLKVTGKLLEHNPYLSRVKLVDSCSTSVIILDTSLVEPFDVQPGSLCQVIGEVDSVTDLGQPLLKIRIIRGVDDLDLVMYERAIRIQQEFLEDLRQ